MIEGIEGKYPGVEAYLGIRYGRAERWAYGEEVTHWDGIYDATHYGNCAYQMRSFVSEWEIPGKNFYYNEFRKDEAYTYDEDCLFLNIWTRAGATEGDKLPVLVFLHGGSFTSGCGNEKPMEPVWPALENGVVGVTINYRLGPLGFLVLPELQEEEGRCGNYGLDDQFLALKWIHHNIAAFGGDPENVTLMGQSAGAMSVQKLCMSDKARGYFHRAVMSSGCSISPFMNPAKPEKRYPFWKQVMRESGARCLEEFRRVEPEVLFEAWEKTKKARHDGGMACFPTIDGELVVNKDTYNIKNNRIHNIPYIIGFNEKDIILPILRSSVKKWVKACEKIDGATTYTYHFTHALPGDDKGTWHSCDLWYWFGSFQNCWRPMTEEDQRISDNMIARLMNFARNGNPNEDGQDEWKSGLEPYIPSISKFS